MQFAMNWFSNTVLKLDTESLDRWALLLKLLVAGATAIDIWRALIQILLHPAIFSSLTVPDPAAVSLSANPNSISRIHLILSAS